MSKTDLEKVLNDIYENYTMVKDVHDTAYSMNSEYKLFWDSHPEETKAKFLKAQKLMSVSQGGSKAQEALFHLGTFGLSYGMKKLFQIGKPTREEKIRTAVTSDGFTEIIKALNSALWEKK